MKSDPSVLRTPPQNPTYKVWKTMKILLSYLEDVIRSGEAVAFVADGGSPIFTYKFVLSLITAH